MLRSLHLGWQTRGMACILTGALATVIGLGGCAVNPVERGFLNVGAGEYEAAFDAADEVARSYGLVPALRDRRSGILETQPTPAGTLFEPWDRATVTLDQAAANTLSFQRRRARFEFQPAGFGGSAEHTGGAASDLTALGPTHELELRVWVYTERAHVPGIRRSAWSRRLTTLTEVIDPEADEVQEPVWTVVARDRALEERLLSEVGRLLGR